MHTIEQAKAQEVVYFKGDKARFNGEIDVLYGGVFAKAEVLEGSRKGHIVYIMVDMVEQEGS